MHNFLIVSSKALRRRNIEINGQLHRHAAILPFFDSLGRIPLAMVVVPGCSRLWFFDPAQAQPRVPFWGPVRMKHSLFSSSDGEVGPDLTGLWHYDPDWLLRDEWFAGMSIVPCLRATNCSGKLNPKVSFLMFRRDLRQLAAVWLTEEQQISRFSARLLPEKPQEQPPPSRKREPRRGGWRLAPIWQRGAPQERP